MPHRSFRLPMPMLALVLILLPGCSTPPSETSDDAAGPVDRPAATAATTAPVEPQAAATIPQQPAGVENARPDQKPSPGAQWGDATIPAGTTIMAMLQKRIDSGSAKSGTIVRAVTDAPVKVGDVEVLPAGSTFDGLLGQVIPANEGATLGGTIALRWRLVRTPVGSAAPLEAEVSVAVAAPGGSAGLTIAGPEAVAEGTSGGTILAAGAKGEELVLEKGTRLTLVLSDAVPIKVRL